MPGGHLGYDLQISFSFIPFSEDMRSHYWKSGNHCCHIDGSITIKRAEVKSNEAKSVTAVAELHRLELQ